MARKKKHAEHENHERWLVSYADLLTLLFALFVVLYAFATAKQTESKQLVMGLIQSFTDMGYISPSPGSAVMNASPNVMSSGESSKEVSIPASKPSMLVQAPTQGGGGVMDIGASTTVPQPSSKMKGEQNSPGATNPRQTSIAAQVGDNSSGAPFDKVRQELRSALQQQIAQGSVSFQESEEWLTIELNSDLVFPAGSATLLKRSLPVVNKIASILKPMNNYVRVRGYTDNTPTTPELYASNWELSAKRAEAVLVALQHDGIIPERMAIEAYGEYSPFVSNSTEEGRQRNRKVAIAISRYVREVKPLEVIAPVATTGNSTQAPTVDTDKLKVIQLPDGRFRVERR
ncbi:OmpA family protein [Tolumonas lignilytica]|jgi:Flagellar motor protein|uniref:OmpA family protein n=1 Tax=Tolumonas lignilytica TaxID=1283284 RepID=UPI000466B8CD|nr:OmpA family protein [Tolumonas lignilytica]